MDKFFKENGVYFYSISRIIVGILFLLHGVMKIGMISDGKITLMSLMGLAMVIEVVGGILLIVGLFTRYTAIIASVEMVVAYFMAHISKSYNPLQNGGEPALLFFAAFLVLMAYGSGRWAVDNVIKR
jgi:putative oxidoreductase